MSLQVNHVYQFEDFYLDPKEKTLRHGHTIVPVTPKVFEMLHLFVENPGRLVEKDELMEGIWPGRVVEESNLTFNIKMLRRALGDHAQKPQFIETVQSRGYRFIADVRRVEAERPENGPATRPNASGDLTDRNGDVSYPPTSQASRHRRSRPLVLAAIGALIVGVVGLGYYFFAGKRAGGAYGDKSIAVLPVKPINAANRDDIYELGIADSLINKLGSMSGLILRPLSATRKYVDIDQDPLAAGKEQKVDYVLASNYQLADGRIRITAQLLNVASGQIEETYKSENDAADVFAMQDAIASEVGKLLSARFGTAPSRPTAKRGTTDEEAYRLFLLGMHFVDKREPAEARKAVELFEQALGLDPNYAQAWAGKAHAHRVIGGMGRSGDSHEGYQKALEAINKALALDENLADAHSALCEAKMTYAWEFEDAERECKRAIQLDPNSSLAHQIYSRFLMGRGRFDESIAEIKTAIDLEPTSLFSQRLYGSSLYFARRYPEAVAQLMRVIAMDPSFAPTYPFLYQSLEMQGNYGEAFEWFMKYQALQKADQQTLQNYEAAYHTSDWHGVLLERVKRFEDTNVVYYHGAVLNAKAGNKDKAFEYLEKSYQRRELWMRFLKVDPGIDSLRDDPRYSDLVRRVESK